VIGTETQTSDCNIKAHALETAVTLVALNLVALSLVALNLNLVAPNLVVAPTDSRDASVPSNTTRFAEPMEELTAVLASWAASQEEHKLLIVGNADVVTTLDLVLPHFKLWTLQHHGIPHQVQS